MKKRSMKSAENKWSLRAKRKWMGRENEMAQNTSRREQDRKPREIEGVSRCIGIPWPLFFFQWKKTTSKASRLQRQESKAIISRGHVLEEGMVIMIVSRMKSIINKSWFISIIQNSMWEWESKAFYKNNDDASKSTQVIWEFFELTLSS